MSAPPPLFVLSSPRSFSSVTTAMLGRHSSLYAMPEMNLFLAETLGDLIGWEEELGRNRGYLAGLRRAVAQLAYGGQDEDCLKRADDWIAAHREWTSRRVFEWLMEQVYPRRIVLKSPRTAMALSSMRRMLDAAPGACCLHLTRHPVATIADLAAQSGERSSRSHRFFAQVWLNCQRTILDALDSVEKQEGGRTLRVRGEALLSDPAAQLRAVAAWLCISYEDTEVEAMLHPERSPYAYSLPGLFDGDNDSGFLANPRLQQAEGACEQLSAKELELGIELMEEVRAMGRRLGYVFP